MRNKKVITIALIVGLITSSFSGVFNSYAKSEYKIENTAMASDYGKEETSDLAPSSIITQLESEVHNQEISHMNTIRDKEDNGIVLYQGTKDINDSKDTYNFSEEEIIDLLSQGYSIQELYEADEIGNDIYEDPRKLLNMKKESSKSLKEIKDEVLIYRKEENHKYLKDKYKKEYDELINDELKKEDITLLLSYVDTNKVELTDDLIEQYKSKGTKVFDGAKRKVLSEETRKKYNISSKDAELLSEDLLTIFEMISEKKNKDVKELIKSYIKNNKK